MIDMAANTGFIASHKSYGTENQMDVSLTAD